MKENKRNGIISFWKFIFCLVIIFFHCKYYAEKGEDVLFRFGSIGVEFFFLVSGYLLAKSINKEKEKDFGQGTINILWKKFKSFFPCVLVSIILCYIVDYIFSKLTIKKVLLSFGDLFLIQMSGVVTTRYNSPLWYISALLLCTLILYPLIKKYKENWYCIIGPILLIFLIGYFNKNFYESGFRGPWDWLGFTYKGFLRGLFEMILGTLLFPLSIKFNKLKFTGFGKIFFTIISKLCFIFPLLISGYFIQYKYDFDFIILISLALGIMISFSENVYGISFMNNKFNYFLERISFPMYCFQRPIIDFFDESKYFLNYSYKYKTLFVFITLFIFSIFFIYGYDFVKKINKKHLIKKLFIKNGDSIV